MPHTFVVFTLVSIRLLTCFLFLPGFGGTNMAFRWRLGIPIVLSLMIASISWATAVSDAAVTDNSWSMEQVKPAGWHVWNTWIAQEVIIGASHGLAISLMLVGCQLALELVNGIAGGVLRTGLSTQSLPTSFPYVLMTAIFFSVQGHHAVINAVLDSIRWLPVGGEMAVKGSSTELIGRTLQASYQFGLQLSLPVAFSVVMSNVAIAVLGRTVRELNLLSVGMGLNLVVVLVASFLFLGGLGVQFEKEIRSSLGHVQSYWSSPAGRSAAAFDSYQPNDTSVLTGREVR